MGSPSVLGVLHPPASAEQSGARPSGTEPAAALTGEHLRGLDVHESRLRLRAAWLMIFNGMIGCFGVLWDIQWHVDVGRDSFLTPPHLTLYTASAVSGLISLWMVLWSTWRFRRGALEINERTTVQLWGFRGPLGFMVSGFGSLALVVAAPFDNYWHQLYGIDVSIWEPFHMMGMFGNTVAIFGLMVLLSSEFNRAVRRGELGARAGLTSSSVAVAGLRGDDTWRHPTQLAMAAGLLVALTATFIVAIPAAQGSKIVGHIVGVPVFVYPILLGVLLPMALALAGLIMRSPFAATSVALMMTVWRFLTMYTVPIAVEQLRLSEGMPYRPGMPYPQLLSRYLPLTLILGGIAVDWYRHWHKKRQSAREALPEEASGALMGLLATLPVVLTWYPYLNAGGSKSEGARKVLTSVPMTTVTSLLMAGLVSMVVGYLMSRLAHPLKRVLR